MIVFVIGLLDDVLDLIGVVFDLSNIVSGLTDAVWKMMAFVICLLDDVLDLNTCCEIVFQPVIAPHHPQPSVGAGNPLPTRERAG